MNSYGFCTSIKKRNAKKTLDKAILIGGPGSNNWYHFILECLPKLFLINSISKIDPNAYIIAPEICKFNNSFKESLDLFAGKRKIFYLKKEEFILCRKLYTVSDFNITPFNLPNGKWPRHEDFLMNIFAIKEFSLQFRKYLKILNNKTNYPQKLFLLRDKKRRTFNQDELFEIAKKYGYVAIYLEKLSLKKQAEMISNATHIIGASGAAWTSLLFANKSLRCLSWLPKEYFEFSTYSTLAELLGHYLLFIEYYPAQNLKNSWQVYGESYNVKTIEFEEALQKLEE